MVFIESLVLVELSAKKQANKTKHNCYCYFPQSIPTFLPLQNRTIVELFTHGLFHLTRELQQQLPLQQQQQHV